MQWINFLIGTKEIVVTVAAAAAAYIAWMGLSTWRAQLKGQTEYDLARRMLVGLYKYRDAIGKVRAPAMFGHEMPSPPENLSHGMTPQQISYFGRAGAYQKRWQDVLDRRSEMYPDLLEARAVWGEELDSLFREVDKLQNKLFIVIHSFLEMQNPDVPEGTKRAFEKNFNQSSDVMFDLSTESTPDDFKKELGATTERIEKYLKRKLEH